MLHRRGRGERGAACAPNAKALTADGDDECLTDKQQSFNIDEQNGQDGKQI
jgi:hypothetical protein